MKINANYTQMSNLIKIVLLIAGPAVSWLHNGNDFNSAVFSNTTALAVVAIIIITILDKLHSEINSTLTRINDNLETSFEYHGLLDSPKDKFTAIEMREKWPLIIEKVKNDFIALNNLSHKSWIGGRGDELVGSLGVRVSLKQVRARRLFIIENISELELWKNTLQIHQSKKIDVKLILFSDFEFIRSNYSRHDPSMKNTIGFNVVDREKPGIVIDWIYKDRETEGANLKRGPSIAESYTRFFNTIWDDHRCLTHS